MKIAVIGAGNVGGALAKSWAGAGHDVVLGVKDIQDEKLKPLLEAGGNISADSVSNASAVSDVIVIAAVPGAVKQISEQLGDVKDKIIIDAMNSLSSKPEPFPNTTEALKEWTNCENIVKCFNTTGFENMENPVYNGEGIDMFVTGDSVKGKETAVRLSKDLGFARCYDFGGDDKFQLLENFAFSWINLAIMQKLGRGMAFKILKR